MTINLPIDAVHLPDHVESEMSAPLSGMWSIAAIELDGGHVQINQNWAHPLRRYQVSLGACSDDEFIAIRNVIISRRGLRGFLFKDWSDYRAVDQLVGVGDGANRDFQLVKVYADDVLPYTRPLTRPIASTITVALDGSPTSAFAHVGKGLIRMTSAPALGVDVTASCEFDVPVRFSDPLQAMTLVHEELGIVDSFTLVECRDDA